MKSYIIRRWSQTFSKHTCKDEATFDRRDISQDVNFKHLVMNNKTTTMWEQWAGVIQRGRPETLILSRLKPKLTVKRAPKL